LAQTQTTVNVRVDENVKLGVEQLFESMGMNISTAVNMFFRQCLLERALPFQPGSKQITLSDAIEMAQEEVKAAGASDMSLDEINSMIAEVRMQSRGME